MLLIASWQNRVQLVWFTRRCVRQVVAAAVDCRRVQLASDCTKLRRRVATDSGVLEDECVAPCAGPLGSQCMWRGVCCPPPPLLCVLDPPTPSLNACREAELLKTYLHPILKQNSFPGETDLHEGFAGDGSLALHVLARRPIAQVGVL